MEDELGLQEPSKLHLCPAKEILALLDQTKDRQERTRLLALVLSSEPSMSGVLQDQYGYSPEQFADLFAEASSELFRALPDDYDLEFSFEALPGSIGISNWIVSKEVIREVDDIVAEDFKSSKLNYKNHFEMKQAHYGQNSSLPAAGLFGYTLMKIQDDPESEREPTGIIIEELHSGLTKISLREDMAKRVGDIQKVYPTPLRWKEGAAASVSDAIRLSEEKLIGTIGKGQNHSALILTTPPSDDGKKMLARQGYTSVEQLMLPEQELAYFRNSYAYERGMKRGYTGKVVFVPEAA